MAEKLPTKVWHVDDSEEWRLTISSILAKAGFQPTSTGTVDEAKKIVLDPDRIIFPVAILDNRLGRGTGEEIAVLLREKQPTIGIIGLAEEEMPWADVSLKKNGFAAGDLLRILARLLDEK